MKFIVTLGLVLSFSLLSFADDKADAKRDVAQSRPMKLKIYQGTSTAHKLMNEEPTYYVTIYGEAAKTMWRSLKTKQADMNSGAVSTEKWNQKVSTNITCDRTYDADEKKTEYSCGMSFVDGVAQGGGAG